MPSKPPTPINDPHDFSDRMQRILDRAKADVAAGRVQQLAVICVSASGSTTEAYWTGDHPPLTLVGALHKSTSTLLELTQRPRDPADRKT